MILVSIWFAKGEGRESRDQKVGDDGNKRDLYHALREGSSDVHMQQNDSTTTWEM
jgi:hypothetical protein